MKLVSILRQSRRDTYIRLKCENCGYETERSGYDDRNFYDNVIPKFKCQDCGQSSNDLGTKTEFTQTKYESWEVV